MTEGEWSFLFPYFLGVITGAALAGWSPAFLARWEARREERRQRRTSERIKQSIIRRAEEIKNKKAR